MSRLALLGLAALVLAASSADVRESVLIEVTPHGVSAAQLQDLTTKGVTVVVRSLDASQGTAEMRCLAGVPCRLPAPPGVRSWASLREPGYWSPEIELGMPAKPGSPSDPPKNLPVFRAAELTGLLVPKEGRGHRLEEAAMSISWPPIAVIEKEPPQATGEQPCTVEEKGQFRCSVPAIPVDARLQVEGFAPLYFWGIHVPEAGAEDLGKLQLIEGASLIGWLEVEGRTPKGAMPKLSLVPVPQGTTNRLQSPKSRIHEGRAGETGFFQLQGLSAGHFTLAASLEGYGEGSVPSVILVEGEETELAEAVRLLRPAELEVTLEPGTDAYGQPWVLRVLEERPERPAFRETVSEGSPNEGGSWKTGPLRAGKYHLEVSDRQGSVWVQEALELSPELNSLFLEVPLIAVEGTVHLGDEPVEGRLWFGGKRRLPNIVVEVDADGEFSGYLPKEGMWALDLESSDRTLEQAIDPVEVEVSEGQSVARVELRLPATKLAVRVVDEAGEGVGDADLVLVRLEEGKRRREATARTDGDGTFSFRGLAEGDLVVRARKAGAESEWAEVSLREKMDAPELRLQLVELVQITVRVSRNGAGVAGAAVHAKMVGKPVQKSGVTGPGGQAELSVPKGRATVTVSAPGQGFRVLQMIVSEGQTQPVEVGLAPSGGRLVIDLEGAAAAGVNPQALRVMSGDPRGGSGVSILTLLGSLRLPIEDRSSAVMTIPTVEPGEWALCDGASKCVSGFLAANGQLELALSELPPGAEANERD